jgi:DNA-binding transcriptional ArsR family regulator
MEKTDALAAFGALSQETRLDVFRLLVKQGPNGLSAGQIGSALEIAPTTLSFHLAQLSHAGLVSMRRDGRYLFYSAAYTSIQGLLRFLIEDCCRGVSTDFMPQPATCATPKEK